MGCQMFIFLLERRVPGFPLSNLKLAWKTATLIALVTTKYCSGLTFLFINNQDLSPSGSCYIIPVSCDKMDRLGHCPSQICIECHSYVYLCPVIHT